MSHVIVRADELATKRVTAALFVRRGSGRVVTPVLAVLVLVRSVLGDWMWADAVAVAVVVVLTGPVEWVLHRHVLHAPTGSFTTRRLGLGLGHRKHHLDPPELQWLLLNGVEMAVFLVLLAVATAVWSLPFAWMFDASLVRVPLTALVCTVAAAGHYEWTHLLVHTTYRPRSRYYARLARNHRRHHYRNEAYWLGVTSNLGDRLLGTLPRSGESVPRSDTAKSLSA